MKIIFSDVDGVLNCSRTPNPRRFPYIAEPKLVARLHTVLARTGAQVVLTSTWRYDPAGIFSAKHWGRPIFLRSRGATKVSLGFAIILA
jgi:hypothetical protein